MKKIGAFTPDINTLEGAFTKVNPRKFTIRNYYQVNSFMLEVCVPYEIVKIYYTNQYYQLFENFRL